MARKFMALGENLATIYNPEVPFTETFYFFYGTLMDPAILGRVLKRPESNIPQEHKAAILWPWTQTLGARSQLWWMGQMTRVFMEWLVRSCLKRRIGWPRMQPTCTGPMDA